MTQKLVLLIAIAVSACRAESTTSGTTTDKARTSKPPRASAVRYALRREFLLGFSGLPCTPPPWGTLQAIDLVTGKVRWNVPLGTLRDVAAVLRVLGQSGSPNLGGPIATASGLVFIAATMDNYIRAFDIENGKELWQGRLPAGGQATPMTYRTASGRQLLVIAAGGHTRLGTKRGDSIVAFALPEAKR